MLRYWLPMYSGPSQIVAGRRARPTCSSASKLLSMITHVSVSAICNVVDRGPIMTDMSRGAGSMTRARAADQMVICYSLIGVIVMLITTGTSCSIDIALLLRMVQHLATAP